MQITNIQIFFTILLIIFCFLFLFKQEEKNLLKPNENKFFKKIDKKKIFFFVMIFIIFSLAILENQKTKTNYLYTLNNKQIEVLI